MSPPQGSRFLLTKSLRAVKLDDPVSLSIDNPGILTMIPAGETLEVDGVYRISGMRNVIWKGKFYALFEVDLLANAKPL